MKTKKLYKVRLNYYGEIHEFYLYAPTIPSARVIGIRRLATKLRIKEKLNSLYGYFDGSKDNIKITEE